MMVERADSLSAAAAYSIDVARDLLQGKSIVALTGAGLSTDSGIPDYRGEGRVAKHPMTYDVFMGSHEARVRYWARSFVGWSRIADAKPNLGHRSLSAAQANGRLGKIITQNVDGLHQSAGALDVIDLHGRLDRVVCTGCKELMNRLDMDALLLALNPSVRKSDSIEFSPDGDAEVEAPDDFAIPDCPRCSAILKPDVVFFGEAVPVDRSERAMAAVEAAEALLVAGTSLTVNSGMRFARAAAKSGKPIVIVNLGPTKADELAVAKIEANTSLALERLLLG
jgi:NAD-dependent SIR2 family protein deacetylase